MPRADEAKCIKCEQTFTSGEAFVAHEGPGGRCRKPDAAGLVQAPHGVWGFPGRTRAAREHKGRRSQAQAAMDRIVGYLPPGHRKALEKDLEKVHRVLERERER